MKSAARRRSNRSPVVARTVLLSLAIAVVGCKAKGGFDPVETAVPGQPGAPGQGGGEGEYGTVVLAITSVPSDVGCVRVTASGTVIVTRTFDVTSGAAANLAVTGLPVGDVTIVEEAFAVGCSGVGPNTAATWVSEAPVPVTLVPGQQASITVVLRRPAGLGITNDFRDGSGTVTVSPASHDFGLVVAGGASASVPFTVTNGTAGAVTVTVTSGSSFLISANGCGALMPMASCTVQAQFSPPVSAIGVQTGVLSVSWSGGVVSAALQGTAAAAGGLTISPTSQSFGSVPVAAASRQYDFTVVNGSSTTVTPTLSIGGANASEYHLIAGGACASLAPMQTCTASIDFHPAATGMRTASLNVGSSVNNLSAPLIGTGVPNAGLTISPTQRAFSSVLVGQLGAPSTFTVTNSSAGMVALTASIGGDDPSDFVLAASTCATLAPGATCTVQAQFAPVAAGFRVASLNVSTTGGMTSAIMSGNAQPHAAVVIGPASFPAEPVGSQSPVTTVRITNGTAAPVSIPASLTGMNPADFAITGGSCLSTTSLPAESFCNLDLVFKPTAAGARSATLQLGSVASAPLSGTGLTPAAVTVTPTSASFGSIPVGAQSGTILFTLNNETAGNFMVIPAIGGSNAGDFAFAATTCSPGVVMAPGGICTFQVYFKPTAGGIRGATLTFGTSGPTAALSGTGSAWSGLDVGDVGASGSASEMGGTYRVLGSGADIWSGADAFHFYRQSVTGDATIIARVTGVTNTSGWAKAGVMMRAGTAAGAMNAFAFTTPTPSYSYRFQVRSATGGSTSSSSAGAGTVPAWLRLVRRGNSFTASQSPDGVSWSGLGSTTTISMPSTIDVGLAVTAHAKGAINASTFDHVTLTQP